VPLLDVRVIDNPVAQDRLRVLRSRGTPRWVFREVMEECGCILAYEASRQLPSRPVTVETPLAEAQALELLDERVVVVAVLRAGLPLAHGMLRVWRRARMGFVAAKRIEEWGGDVFPVDTPYINIPSLSASDMVVVADPMLATASTMLKVIGILEEKGARNIIIGSVISSKKGVERLRMRLRSSPARVMLYTFSVDPLLDSRGFIIPGLGDAGDRSFTL